MLQNVAELELPRGWSLGRRSHVARAYFTYYEEWHLETVHSELSHLGCTFISEHSSVGKTPAEPPRLKHIDVPWGSNTGMPTRKKIVGPRPQRLWFSALGSEAWASALPTGSQMPLTACWSRDHEPGNLWARASTYSRHRCPPKLPAKPHRKLDAIPSRNQLSGNSLEG